MSLGFSSSPSKGILCGGGWWQLVVIPAPSQMVALYHLAAQKLGLLVSSICCLKLRSFICFIFTQFPPAAHFWKGAEEIGAAAAVMLGEKSIEVCAPPI